MKVFKSFVSCVLFGMSLIACGGGGDAGSFTNTGSEFFGNLSPSTADADNAKDLALAAAELVKQAFKQDAPAFYLPQLPGASGGFTGPCGGTLEADVADDGSTGDFIYTNYCLGDAANSLIFSGNTQFVSGGNANQSSTGGNDITLNYIDFRLTFPNTSYVLNMKADCQGSLIARDRCEYASDFEGENQVVYRSREVTISDRVAGSNLRTVAGEIFDPRHGSITISAAGMVLCANLNIGEGLIGIVDGTGVVVVEVTFPGCDAGEEGESDAVTLTLTFDGDSETIAQP